MVRGSIADPETSNLRHMMYRSQDTISPGAFKLGVAGAYSKHRPLGEQRKDIINSGCVEDERNVHIGDTGMTPKT